MYLVLEIQKTDNDVAWIVTKHADQNEAQSKYHTVLAAAAVSKVPLHSAVLMDDSGYVFEKHSYEHGEVKEEEQV